MPFVKLDTGILDSSLWSEPAQTCKCWITLLAMADANGIVRSTAPGIARRANLGLSDTEKALAMFESPDAHSRSLNDEGKRIKRIDGGYQITNYGKYRERDYTAAERMRRHRKKLQSVTRNGCNKTVTLRKQKQKQSTEADKEKKAAAEPPTVEERLTELQQKDVYKHINVRALHAKMVVWCEVRGLQPTLRRLVTWLNREDKPLPPTNGTAPPAKMSAFEITKRLEAIEERLGQTVFDKEKHKDERDQLYQRRRELKALLRT